MISFLHGGSGVLFSSVQRTFRTSYHVSQERCLLSEGIARAVGARGGAKKIEEKETHMKAFLRFVHRDEREKFTFFCLLLIFLFIIIYIYIYNIYFSFLWLLSFLFLFLSFFFYFFPLKRTYPERHLERHADRGSDRRTDTPYPPPLPPSFFFASLFSPHRSLRSLSSLRSSHAPSGRPYFSAFF